MTFEIADSKLESQVYSSLNQLKKKHDEWMKQQDIANKMLYALLEECLEFYRFIQKDERYAVVLKRQFAKRLNTKIKLVNLVAESVFGKTKKTYTYAKALLRANVENIGMDGNISMSQWLTENKGINGVIRTEVSKSEAQDEHYIEIANNYVKFIETEDLGVIQPNKLTKKFRPNEIIILIGKVGEDYSVKLKTCGSNNEKIKNDLFIDFGKTISESEDYYKNLATAQAEIDAENKRREAEISAFTEGMTKRIELKEKQTETETENEEGVVGMAA